MLEELARHGFVEGPNLTIDPDVFELRVDQFRKAAIELGKVPVDVILATVGNPSIRPAQVAPSTRQRLPVLLPSMCLRHPYCLSSAS
jgi:hypothetical protein